MKQQFRQYTIRCKTDGRFMKAGARSFQPWEVSSTEVESKARRWRVASGPRIWVKSWADKLNLTVQDFEILEHIFKFVSTTTRNYDDWK